MAAQNTQLKGAPIQFDRALSVSQNNLSPLRTSIVGDAVADDGVLQLLVQTHATIRSLIEVVGSMDSGASAARVEVFEGTTFSGAGTASDPVSVDRPGNAPPNNATVTHTPTVTDPGTRVGVSDGRPLTLRLSPDEDYLVRITNHSGGAAAGFLELAIMDAREA